MSTALSRCLALLVCTAVLLALLPGPAQAQEPRRVRLPDPASRTKAPEFPKDFDWLNTDQPLQIHGNLKGHVILLDFWTYCCINCIHILPDLEYLENKYADQPVVVIGVHSAKFETESDARNIRQAIQRYRIHHPVIVDQDMTIWDKYGARAWPTFVMIDSAGRVVGQTSSEGQRELLDAVIHTLLIEGKENGTLAEKPIDLKPVAQAELKTGTLAFPGKVVMAGEQLWVADSNHDRLLVTDAAGQVKHVIGSGERGFEDGSMTEARFANPQGIAVSGQVAYVADTDNHAIRKIDLAAGTVTTIAGDGKRSYDRQGGKAGTKQGLASPWDLVIDGDRLIIANAGTHQLWQHDLKTGFSKVFTGNGRENIVDGPPSQAQLAQPSGLTIAAGWVYFADSEVSAVRRASLDDGRVETLIGKGLFKFGHVDGSWNKALLQHCLGVAAFDDKIAVADTYNSAIRIIDLNKKTIDTLKLTGNGADLDEPGGINYADGHLYVADTNNHRLVRIDLETNEAEVVTVALPEE